MTSPSTGAGYSSGARRAGRPSRWARWRRGSVPAWPAAIPAWPPRAGSTADHMVYPYGIHAAVVRVDPESGLVEVERLVVAYEVGKAVNPELVNGQIAGGAAQGIGGALLEDFAYDESGQPLAATFMDYLMPTIAEMPEVEVLLLEEAPSPLNPLGVKGAGEGGITAVGAAIANGVADALGCPEEVTRLPLGPERVRRIVTGVA